MRKRAYVKCNGSKHDETTDNSKRRRLSSTTNSKGMKDRLIHRYLHKMGHKKFRRKQLQVIKDVVDGKNVFLCMATGGGKSLCFQIATLVRNELHDTQNCRKASIGIVICPLIALMADQVNKLKKQGIAGALWNSTLTGKEKEQFRYNIMIGKISIVYTTPESLLSRCNGIKDLLLAYRTVSTFCIDETHCIIMWGSSFRPSYFNLAAAVESFGNPPVIACSATVPSIMRQDILHNLHITQNVKEYLLNSNRSNLELNVQRLNTGNEVFLKALHIIFVMHHKYGMNKNGMVIYSGMVKTGQNFHAFLKTHLPKSLGISVGIYHGQLKNEDRKSTLNDFIDGRTNIIVATSGFGMGIDKPNVRCVIHLAMPPNPEEWAQQIGRAGRDGLQSHAYLLTHAKDKFALFCIEKNCKKEVKRTKKFLFKNYHVNPNRQIGTTREIYGQMHVDGPFRTWLCWDELFDYKKYKNAMDILQRYGVIHKAGKYVYLMSKDTSHIDWEEIDAIDKKNIDSHKEMRQILNSSGCLRKRLQSYFGEKFRASQQSKFPCLYGQ